MAQNIKLTTLVDVSIEQGKVDSSKLQKQLPKLLEQAIAKLPGAKAALSPNIEIDPKFNTKKIVKQLDNLVADPKFKEVVDTKGFQDMEKVAIKYSRALEHIANIQNQFKSNKDLEKFFNQWQAGQVSLSNAPAKMQQQVRELRNHWQEISKIWNQVQREFSKINDSVHTPMQLKELRSLEGKLKYREARILELDSKATKAVADPSAAKDLGKLTAQREKYVREIAELKAQYDDLKAPGKRQLGALADPMVSQLTNAINGLLKGIDTRIAAERKDAQRKGKEQERREKAETKFKEGTPEGAEARRLKELTQQTLELSRRKEAEAKFKEGTPEGAEARRIKELTQQTLELNRRRAADERRRTGTEAGTEDRRIRELTQQTLNFAQLRERQAKFTSASADFPASVRAGIRSGSLAGVTQEDLAHARTVNREQLRVLEGMRQNTKQYELLTEAEKRVLDNRRRNLLADRSLLNAERRSRSAVGRPSITPEQQALIDRGNIVRRATPNVYNTAQEDVPARRAALNSLISSAEANMFRVGQTHGLDSRRYEAAAKGVARLKNELTQLNSVAHDAHPIWRQLGRLIAQFSRYAIGYAALYRVTQGIQALGAAVVDLEDKAKSIQAITGSTEASMTSLSESIKKVAETTGFDLNEISDAVRIIAQSGVALKDIPRTTQAVANLATAAGTSLQTAADVITTVKEVWEDIDVETIGDRITQAANVSKLAVEDLQTILSLQASAAEQSNISLDQNLGLIATLRNSGIRASTIGTGSTQLLLELLSPDKQLSKFLSTQYHSIGEDKSETEAAKQFASFRSSENPLLSALQELKRIGADSAEATIRLERSLDRRALRVLNPLLRNVDELPITQAQMLTAPTSFEAAQVAMDSLKKSLNNLGDAMKSLTNTVVSDSGALKAMQDFTRSVTSVIHFIDEQAQNAQSLGGPAGGMTAPSLMALLAGALGFSRGQGLLSSGMKALGYATTAGGITAAANTTAKNAEVPDAVTTAGNIALGAWLVSQFGQIKGWLSKIKLPLPPAATAAAQSTNAAISTWFATQLTSLRALLPTALSGTAKLTATITGIGVALVGMISNATEYVISLAEKDLSGVRPGMISGIIRNAVLKFVTGGRHGADSASQGAETAEASVEPGIRPTELARRQAQRRIDQGNAEQGLRQFLPLEADQAPTNETAAGQIAILKSRLDKMRANISAAIGKTLTEDTDQIMLEAVEAIRLYGLGGTERKRLISDLTRKLGGTSETTDELVRQLTIESGDIVGQAQGFAGGLLDTFLKLKEKMPAAGSLQEYQLKVLSELQETDPIADRVLKGRSVTAEQSVKVFEKYVAAVRKFNGGVDTTLERATVEIEEQFNALMNSAPGDELTHNAQLAALIREGIRELGIKATEAALAASDKALTRARDSGALEDPMVRRNAMLADETVRDVAGTETARLLGRDVEDLRSLEVQVGRIVEAVDKLENPTRVERDMRDFAELFQGELPDIIKEVARVQKDFAEHPPTQEDRKHLAGLQETFTTFTRAGAIQRGVDGLELGSQLLPGKYLADKQMETLEAPVAKAFVGGEAYRRLVDQLNQAERDQKNAARDGLPLLADESNADNPIIRKRDAKVAILEMRRAHELAQPLSEAKEAKDILANTIQDLDTQIAEAKADAQEELDKAKADINSIKTKGTLRELNRDLAALMKTRTALEDAGNIEAIDSINAQILEVREQRYVAEKANLELTYKGVEKEEQLEALRQRHLDELESLQAVDSFIKTGAARIANLQGTPAGGDADARFYEQARLEASGAYLPTQAAIQQTQAVEKGVREVINATSLKLGDAKTLAASMDPLSEQYRAQQAIILKLQKANQDYHQTLGKVRQELDDLNATPLSEFNQISAGSVGAKIDSLPQSLRNLNNNIEDRLVSAADGVADVMADAVDSVVADLLGMGEAADESSAALSALRDAQIQLNDVVLGSLDVAQQINDIRANETDPERQEYLINRALEAQAEAERLARMQVEQAQKEYDSARYNDSIFGKLASTGADMFGGIAQDMAKGGILNLFGDLFGSMGKRDGSTEEQALWVRLSGFGGSGGLLGGGEGSRGLLGSVIDGAGSLISGISNIFGGGGGGGVVDAISAGAAGTGTAGAAVSEAAGAAGGAGSIMGGAGAGIVSGLVSIGSTLFDYFGAKKQQPQVIIQRATGGYVSGPGTSTSDSIPAKLSNGEYVISAAAVQRIGRDTLDAWNFSLAKPARFASGGMFGEVQASVNSRQSAPAQQPAPAPAAPPQAQSIRVVMVDDQRRVGDFISSAEGEKTLIDFVRRNSLSLRQVLQG